MIFNSLEYAAFLFVVLGVYWNLGRRMQNLFLLAASYLFYGAWDWRFLFLLLASTAVDYSCGRRLEKTDLEGQRRAILLFSLVVNLGILGLFKYYGFFAESLAKLFDALGFAFVSTPTLEILLPVGISFYTFQTMAYTIDVFRRRIPAERGLANFALYVAFFPQLVAGPIERPNNLLPQFAGRRKLPSTDRLMSAALLILLGLFKKVAIADALAPEVDRVFAGAGTSGWMTLLMAVYAFALQIYCDFSGYTDIARGSSRLLGIELMENFEQPYLSRSITAFWRTWHVSLSSWLRDYLYIPLGGNRGGPRRRTRNLMLTMLLGGLWHGAAWTFVAWGALHGVFLAVDHFLTGRRRQLPTAGVERAAVDGPFRLRDVPAAVATFHLVCLAWVFFRADTLTAALQYLGGLLSLRAGVFDTNLLALLAPAVLAVVLIDVWQRGARDHTVMLQWPAPARGAFYAACCLGVLLFSGGTPVQFIYFQF